MCGSDVFFTSFSFFYFLQNFSSICSNLITQHLTGKSEKVILNKSVAWGNSDRRRNSVVYIAGHVARLRLNDSALWAQSCHCILQLHRGVARFVSDSWVSCFLLSNQPTTLTKQDDVITVAAAAAADDDYEW